MAGNSGEESVALAETQSLDQVVSRIASMLPPSSNSEDDDDDDCEPKPSELYGKYTWTIHEYSNIEKKELRSNAFEVGGCKWYILIYPQGGLIDDHISLFLCVANHEKLLTGWSHFVQFTISVVNKDPKKSKYSDTIHRFWKNEHDWGWKKYMETSKALDGFLEDDTFIIKTQIQVIREKADRPFRCLDSQYKRELLRVYLSNVEQIYHRFVEEKTRMFKKLIGDNGRWSSFWSEIAENSQQRMSSESSDLILKEVVKHFFIEKEVTSTLVMESLYSGLRALESRRKRSTVKGKLLDGEESLIPIVQIDQGMFVLVDDVLLLLERAALESSSRKEEKDPDNADNRTMDGGSGENDVSIDSIPSDEKRLAELGHRTIEIFVLAHIFSKIEADEEAMP